MTRLLPVAALALLGACSTAGDGPYPSLAPRPQEKLGFAEPAAPALVAVVPDPALDARIAAIAGDRAKASAAFDTALIAARRTVAGARRAAVGSDAWLDAQTALGTLDSPRGQLDDSVSALEDLAAARARALQPAYPPLDAAIEAARTASNKADADTAALAATLR
jgi:hypothetical protein